jgi:hypothetical protein
LTDLSPASHQDLVLYGTLIILASNMGSFPCLEHENHISVISCHLVLCLNKNLKN